MLMFHVRDPEPSLNSYLTAANWFENVILLEPELLCTAARLRLASAPYWSAGLLSSLQELPTPHGNNRLPQPP